MASIETFDSVPILGDIRYAKAVQLVNIKESDYVNSGYITPSGNGASAGGFYYTNAVEIPNGAKYIVFDKSGTNTGALAAFYVRPTIVHGNFLMCVRMSDLTSETTFDSPIRYEIPAEIRQIEHLYVAFSSRSATPMTAHIVDGETIFEDVTISEFVDKDTNIEYEGYAIHNSGAIHAIGAWDVSKAFPVLSSSIKIRGYINNISSPYIAYAFYTGESLSDSEFVSGGRFTLSENLVNESVDVPSAAKYIRVSVNNTNTAFLVLSWNVEDSVISSSVKVNDTADNKFQRINDVFAPVKYGAAPIQIKLIGDSITAGVGGTGYNASESGGGEHIYGIYYENVNGVCWANKLKAYWESKFPNVTVKNYGTSGRSSGHLLQNISSLVRNDDDIVICMVGTNDRNNEVDPISGETRSISQFYSNLSGIVSYVQNSGKTIVLMACISASVTNETTDKVFHMEDVDMVVSKVASVYGIEYVSVYKLFIDYCETRNITIDSLLSDGLHPNDSGYEVMFQLISNALSVATKRPGATW